LPLRLLGIYLRIRGFSWRFETIYVLRDSISTLRPKSSNAGGPEGCSFLRFLYTNLPVVEGPVSIQATVGIAWWIMAHSSSAAISRRCMLQYVESVFTFSDTNKTATNGEAAWQSH